MYKEWFLGVSISGASSTRGAVARLYFQILKMPLLENPLSFSGFLRLFEHRGFHNDLQIWKYRHCVFSDITDFRSKMQTFAQAWAGVHSPPLTPLPPEMEFGLLCCSHVLDGTTSL